MTSSPLVSVVIPTYNGARWLGQAVESALGQTMGDLEILIVDDASTDGTVEVARAFSDPRVTVRAETANLGLFGNSNRAARLARGRYLKYLYQDDELAPECLAELTRAMEADPRLALATSERTLIDGEGRPVARGGHRAWNGFIPRGEALSALLTYGNVVGEPSTVLLRRHLFEALGGWDERYRQQGDIELWARALLRGDLFYSPRPLSRTRVHGGAATARQMKDPALWPPEQRRMMLMLRDHPPVEGWRGRGRSRGLARLGARLLFHLGRAVARGHMSPAQAREVGWKGLGTALLLRSVLAAGRYAALRLLRKAGVWAPPILNPQG